MVRSQGDDGSNDFSPPTGYSTCSQLVSELYDVSQLTGCEEYILRRALRALTHTKAVKFIYPAVCLLAAIFRQDETHALDSLVDRFELRGIVPWSIWHRDFCLWWAHFGFVLLLYEYSREFTRKFTDS